MQLEAGLYNTYVSDSNWVTYIYFSENGNLILWTSRYIWSNVTAVQLTYSTQGPLPYAFKKSGSEFTSQYETRSHCLNTDSASTGRDAKLPTNGSIYKWGKLCLTFPRVCILVRSATTSRHIKKWYFNQIFKCIHACQYGLKHTIYMVECSRKFCYDPKSRKEKFGVLWRWSIRRPGVATFSCYENNQVTKNISELGF